MNKLQTLALLAGLAFSAVCARAQTFTYTTESSKTTITGFASGTTPSGAITIPATLGGFPVTEIGRAAFKDYTAITSITFAAPANVTKLGVSAFQGCTGLQAAVLPAAITAIPAALFAECTSLSSVTIQNGVTSIGAAAFADCRSLASLALPSTLTSVEESAFANCRSLTSLTIPSGVTSIPGQLCRECRALTAFSLPAGITQIGYAAFYNCTGLTSFALPANVVSIARDAFQGCSNISFFTIQSALSSLGERAFLGCDTLATFVVDAGNPALSSRNGALLDKNQTSLLLCPPGFAGNYAIPSTVTTLVTGAFAHCTALTGVTIPSSVTSIGQDVFYYASALTQLSLPETITSIGAWAFAGCVSLGGVTIPATVASVGDDAFHFDRSLAYALFSGNAPAMGNTVFNSAAAGFTVYYHASTSGFSSPTWLNYPAVALDLPPALGAWLTEYGYHPSVSVASDPNNDGVNLAQAYAFGLNPNENLAGGLPAPALTSGNPGALSISFRGDSAGITYIVEASANLLSWTSEGVTVSAPNANGMRTATVAVPAGTAKSFLRVGVRY